MHASAKQLHVLLGFMASASSTLQAHRDASANTHVTLVSTLWSYGQKMSNRVSSSVTCFRNANLKDANEQSQVTYMEI